MSLVKKFMVTPWVSGESSSSPEKVSMAHLSDAPVTSIMPALKNASMMLTARVDTVMPCAKKPEEKSGRWKWFPKEEIENAEDPTFEMATNLHLLGTVSNIYPPHISERIC